MRTRPTPDTPPGSSLGEASAGPGTAQPEVHAIGCPRCGGALEISEGAALVRCAYCGGAFLARARGATIRFLAPARVTPEIAERAVRDILREPERPSDLATGATRVATELFYVPFWRFRATFIGRVRGKRDVFVRKPVAVVQGGDPETGGTGMRFEMKEVKVGTEDVVEEIQEVWKASITASPLDDLGIPRLSSRRQMAGGLARLSAGTGEIPGLALAGDGPWDGTLIDPMIGLPDARREADEVFERFVRGRGAELAERELVHERLQERESLIFYPVYRVRFQYRGRLFDAAVDGLEGRLVRAVVPGRSGPLWEAFVAIAGGLGLGAGMLLRTIASPSPELLRLSTPAERGIAALAAAAALVIGGVLLGAFARRSGGKEDDVVVTP
jgi:DNA-directed RNA polymerase subunit RPC12/RpoP